MNKRLLIIDDDPRSVEFLKLKVKPLRFQVVIANDQETAYDILRRETFDIALVDLRLKSDPGDLDPDIEVGFATIQYLKERYSALPVIAVTAYDEKSEVNTQAIKAGADDFWSKNPDGSGENLLTKIRKLTTDKVTDSGDSEAPDAAVENTTRRSKTLETMDKVRSRIKKLATTDSTMLLLGEPGTGKGYFAADIHKMSKRKDKPFEVMNCPQVSKANIVSELFGHSAGAYTGAKGRRKGLAASANGGTLFFDEIADLDLECQSVILRFIEQKEIRPLGSDKTVTVDVRIIAATNQDLDSMTAYGRFRRDLLSRLSQSVLLLPPLKDRGEEEIAKLGRSIYRQFRKDHCSEKGLKDIRVSTNVWSELAQHSYPWPENVRELKQIIDSTLMEVGGKNVGLEDFIQRILSKGDFTDRNKDKLTLTEKEVKIIERQNQVLDLIREKGSIRRKDVEELLGCGSTVAWGVLKAMIQNDLIKQEGKGRGARYVMEKNSTVAK